MLKLFSITSKEAFDAFENTTGFRDYWITFNKTSDGFQVYAKYHDLNTEELLAITPPFDTEKELDMFLDDVMEETA